MARPALVRAACVFAVSMLLCTAAQAQLFRAYLASTGSDANPCTLAAPCRLLPKALAVVAGGGEIWMLDSANYNGVPVAITKSVTILAVPQALGSIVASGGPALILATPGIDVTLRNLVIGPLPDSAATDGISMNAGNSLTIDRCTVANLPQRGIVVTAPVSVRIIDSTIRDNLFGILLTSGARGSLTRVSLTGNTDTALFAFNETANTATLADIGDSTVSGSAFGVTGISNHAAATVKVSVRDSRVTRNTTYGLAVQSNAGGAITLAAAGNIVSNNGNGIAALFTGARVLASANTISNNGSGFVNSGGVLESSGNNAMRNNTADESGPVVTAPTQ